MTIIEIQNLLKQTVRDASIAKFGVDLGSAVLEVPPKTELGDAAFPAGFELAKLLKQQSGEKQNPRAIAETLKAEIEKLDPVSRVEVAGPGYLNVFYDRAHFLAANAAAEPLPPAENGVGSKTCVEHTSVNPNKAAHIGHVRNSVLGDTFQRILKATGRTVEVQNYIDNTGVQVADVVVGFVYLEKRDLAQIKELEKELEEQGTSFDYYCWDLYARVGHQYQVNEDLKAKRAEVLHSIEERAEPIASIADHIATRNVECILKTMERLSIRYDLLPRESEILHLHFWDKAFEKMKERGVIRFETEGKNAGCWVMPFESHEGTDEHDADKILVRSNGTVTYTGKDIAYQMWKLGLLGLDFHYRPFWKYADGKEVWITTPVAISGNAKNEADQGSHRSFPEFGHGDVVYNVIDSRQSYPQEVVRKGVAAIFPEKGEASSVHLSYEMVALSPAAAEELGFEVNEDDRGRPFIEMSGRKGLGVKADDLIDRLEANALAEVESRHPDLDEASKPIVARQLAIAALRFFLLKFTRNTIIVFDFKEALATDGETGTFCQYSVVRANSIFRKSAAQGLSLQKFRNIIENSDEVKLILEGEDGDEIWSVVMLAARLEETVKQAANQTEPAILAKYAFSLAKAFNLFYHRFRIIGEQNQAKQAVLAVTADMARLSLSAALDTMGIEVPERM
ncbi:MAG TPA: arginine--tRNA ligase [Pyrinomonadaceae bacterium]|nr:arginine--tRNA ligase [Pyrinomonadaceae bacterium]